MAAVTKSEANDAWTQQMQQAQQAQPCRKRRAQDGDIMMDRGDPQFFGPTSAVSSRRKSQRTTCPVSYADLPDQLVNAALPGDRLDDKPVSSALPAIHTAADAVNILATIAEVVEDPMAHTHQ